MTNTKIIDQLVAALTRILPEGPKDLEKKVRAASQGVFDRLKLVSSEELDVQEQVLRRTRERVQELEKRLMLFVHFFYPDTVFVFPDEHCLPPVEFSYFSDF